VEASDMTHIAKRSDVATRTQWSQHQLKNAFNCIDFADPVRGIFGATPVKQCMPLGKVLLKMLQNSFCQKFQLPRKLHLTIWLLLFTNLIGTFCTAYPKTSWSNGFWNLTNITANKCVGLVFLFVILFQYNEGWQIISCLDKQTNSKVPEVQQVFKSLLCFDVWLDKSHYWDTSNPEHVTKETRATQPSIWKFMMICKESIPIDKEKHPKFHELLHIVDDMSCFGSPLNFCAQDPESLLKDAVKRPGRRTKKHHEGSAAYKLQYTKRLMYSVVIDSVHTHIWDTEDRENSSTEDSNDELLDTNSCSCCGLTYRA
jgi:hypothetical protein